MEITKGSLENISRPASSSERTCSRVSSASLSLISLTDEVPDDNQDQSSFQEKATINATGRSHADATDEDNDSELQKAYEEMQRLDDILAAKIHKEKEVKAQGRDLTEKLWLELNKHDHSSECATETENTRLFLSLATVSGLQEEGDFEPVFGTQVPENEYDLDSRHQEKCDREPGEVKMARSSGVGQEKEPDPWEDSDGRAPSGKKTQQDFVKKNIQLVSGAGSHALSQAEKQRLTELLQENEVGEEENEEGDEAAGADRKDDVWALCVPPGQGYTPEPSSLEQLIHIESTLQLLRSAEGFLQVPRCYTNSSRCQSMSPLTLPEDRLHALLEESMSTHTEEASDMSTPCSPPESDRHTDGHHQSLVSLSEALLTELLTDEYTTSFSRLDTSDVELCEGSVTASTPPLHSTTTTNTLST